MMGVVSARRLHTVGRRQRKEARLSLITLRPMMRAMIATSKDMFILFKSTGCDGIGVYV